MSVTPHDAFSTVHVSNALCGSKIVSLSEVVVEERIVSNFVAFSEVVHVDVKIPVCIVLIDFDAREVLDIEIYNIVVLLNVL
jgi:RNAse (barnase) inhibitor barstar